MKIGIMFKPFGNGHARFGADRFLKIKQKGFCAVDYGMADTDAPLYSWDDAELARRMQEEKAAAELAGIEISQVHGPWRWPPQDSTEQLRQERMEKMKRSILATRLIGCKYWVVHPIMPFGIEEAGTEDAPKTWELNVAFMSELLEYAKEQGVTICLENMPMRNFSMAKPAQILKFVKQMNDEHFKICLDTGHVAVFPDLSAGEAVRELGDAIAVLHVHDNLGEKDQHLWPKAGITDWNDFMQALKEINFHGVFSLEVLPSQELDDETFETECVRLYAVAKELTQQ